MFRHILPISATGNNQRANDPVYTPNRLYRVTPTLMQDTARRFADYRRQAVVLRNPRLQFRRDDVISFYFDPNLGQARAATPFQYEHDINAYLTGLGLGLRLSGTVSMYLTNVNRRDGDTAIGGMAHLEYSFGTRPNVDLDAFLDAMEERMYHNFDIQHVGVRVDISLTDFVMATLRGGSDRLACIPNMPKSAHPIELTDYWSVGALGLYHRKYKQAAPRHLKHVKGLLFYKWHRDWDSHCAIMAIIYGVTLLRLKETLTMVNELNGITPDVVASSNRSRLGELMSPSHADHVYIRDALSACTFLHNGNHLYAEAQTLLQTNRINPFPTHYQLGVFMDQVFPQYNLVVVDESRHILYLHNGSECSVKDPPEESFHSTRRPLRWQDIKRVENKRIYIFYDHVLFHYHPIYNLERFLARNSIHMEVSLRFNPPVNVPEIKNSLDRRMTFCPFCDAAIDAKNVIRHTCNILRCFRCDLTFTNQAQQIAHINPARTTNTPLCTHCRQKCFGVSCLQRHQAGCQGIIFTQCQLCFREVSPHRIRQHRCTTYFCNGCKKNVTNRITYNHRDHPEGYIQYHPCYMSGKKELAKALAKESDRDALLDKLFFAFDFECMLTMTRYQNFKIYIHSVNCVSTCEISVRDDDIGPEGPKIWTQYNMDEFWLHIQQLSTAPRNFWIAHNFKGYDGRILFDYFQSRNVIPNRLLWQGGKLMQMELVHPEHSDRAIIFQDSLNHIARSLAEMPKMFGLDPNIVKKGYFPYTFNSPENQDYNGPIPDKEEFDYKNQSNKDAFNEWYNQWLTNPPKIYNLKDEMTAYCENDVLVLSLALSSYAKICITYGKVNPLPYLTIAQFTFMHYRMSYLPSKQVYYLDYSFDSFARKALHGGNTNVRRFLYECTPEEAGTLQTGEKGLRYIDVQSLYPTVQFYDPMPVGYPQTVIYYNDQPSPHMLGSFFGFIECDIEPTEFLFHPMIGRFAHNKLFMDLHPHKKVVLTSVEFQAAVSERGGYGCTHVYRIDKYEKSYTLFRPFVKNWLRLKILSSKPPFDPDTPEFEDFKCELLERFGFSVEASDFQPNPSLRNLAKLVLNSLWGKFGQRPNLMECHIMQTANDMFQYHQKMRMGNIKHVSDASLGTTAYLKRGERLNKWNKKNVAIAAFVTAHARLRLWDVMDRLDDRVIYHDTDSVIYERETRDDYMPEEGLFLGQWESETGDNMIHSFVALAPKTYSYRYNYYCDEDKVIKTQEVTKSKGFSSKPSTDSVLNYDGYKRLLLEARDAHLRGSGEPSTILEVPSLFFRHQAEAGMTFTTEGFKKLSFDYQKGFVHYETWKTAPYGTQRFYVAPDFSRQRDLVLYGQVPPTNKECIAMLCSLDCEDDTEDPM